MKNWKENDFNTALRGGMNGIPAVLIYGADAGAVDEYADKIVEKMEIDSLNLFVVDSNEIKDKTDALFSEACSPSMFGGRRMVWIHNAGDSDAPLIRELVTHSGLSSFVVITAGELRKGGSLRNLFEASDKLAVMPCYSDNTDTLARLIRTQLTAPDVGIKQIDPDAMQYMCGRLGSDRMVMRRYLEVLALYVNDTKTVTLSDVERTMPDHGTIDIDEFMYSLTAGHIASTMRALDRVFFDKTEPAALVRMLGMHFRKLLSAKASGQVPVSVFFQYNPRFQTAMQIWGMDDITSVLERLNELERQTKTTGMPVKVLLRDFALKLSIRAAKLSLAARRK